jgi:hypothetical protein
VMDVDRQVAWDWWAGSSSSSDISVFWESGPLPFAGVVVEESPEHVAVGLWEEIPAPDESVAAVAVTRCVRLALGAPLGRRHVVDSFDGADPRTRAARQAEIASSRELAERVAREGLECEPPSAHPMRAESRRRG